MACILLWSSAVRIHDSQAHRKIDVTRERISLILELREILLPFQTAFNLVNAAVVCAILESISGLGPSSVTTEPRYLKLEMILSHWDFSHGKFGLLSPGKVSCDRIALPNQNAGLFGDFVIHRTLIWTTKSLTCAQMLMHAIAYGGVRTS